MWIYNVLTIIWFYNQSSMVICTSLCTRTTKILVCRRMITCHRMFVFEYRVELIQDGIDAELSNVEQNRNSWMKSCSFTRLFNVSILVNFIIRHHFYTAFSYQKCGKGFDFLENGLNINSAITIYYQPRKKKSKRKTTCSVYSLFFWVMEYI